VAEGDEVTLTGAVSEYYGFTEINNLSGLIIESSGNNLPDPVEITTAELASSEAYESVLVKVNDVEVTIAPNDYDEAFVLGAEFESITGLVEYSLFFTTN